MDDYISIADYKTIYGFKYFKQIVIYFVILVIFIISLILITFNFDYYTYYNGTFLLEKDDEYSFLVDWSDTNKIPDSGVLISDMQEYSYQKQQVLDITQVDQMYLQKMTLKVKMSRQVKIFNGRIVILKEKLFWYIVNYLKGERK